MLIDDLMPGAEAARRARFADTQAFYTFCRREADRGAPRLIRISVRKHFVHRAEFEAWLAERLGSGRSTKKCEPEAQGTIPKLLSRVLNFPKQP